MDESELRCSRIATIKRIIVFLLVGHHQVLAFSRPFE